MRGANWPPERVPIRRLRQSSTVHHPWCWPRQAEGCEAPPLRPQHGGGGGVCVGGQAEIRRGSAHRVHAQLAGYAWVRDSCGQLSGSDGYTRELQLAESCVQLL